MANKNQTVETRNSVPAYIKKIKDATRRNDFSTLVELYTQVTKLEPKMWGSAIVGFGSYHYKYASGREGDAPLAALASRVNSIVLYLGKEFPKRDELLKKLGKYKMSGGCMHIKKLEDIDQKVLGQVVKSSFSATKKIWE